ncbi:S8 family peptidase [Clostridium sp. D53t1_180928_C8]|uniref:S8 family serine peptidase n=1 Tax=Clostridium sp. D53t1_180928_C8 TaxID=2787101 RepID=UPI0018ABDC0C
MNESRFCNEYLDENYLHYVIEYRGNFQEKVDKLDYVCGFAITDTLGVVAVQEKDLSKLREDVPEIIFVEARSVYTLQDIDPSNVDNINSVKVNPYLNLTGKGILVGMVDSGINYLNQEFIREDDTSRIISIWDQNIDTEKSEFKYGVVYNNEKINEAIKVYRSGGDPYSIVNTKDEIDHGTKMAGIIGARGYNGKMQGIAKDCDFLVVKLLQSPNYKKILKDNNLPEVPVYSNAEVLSAINFLRESAKELQRPLIVFIGVGSQEGSHDGYNITARFISSLASREGIIFVSGTGNLGSAEGHASNYIKNVGEVDTVELSVSKNMNILEFYVWVQKPDEMSISVIDPAGEDTGFYNPKIYSLERKDFYLLNTQLEIKCYNPENFTGHQVFILSFNNIKSGVWKIRLKGEYITRGRYDIWLPDKKLLPEGTKFLKVDPYTTLTIPSTARSVVTVAYYDSNNNSIVASSGKGYNSNYLINPDLAVGGINILTTSGTDNKIVAVSGSSPATAIISGAVCLLAQWQFSDIKYAGLYSTKLRSLLIYSATRERNYVYPNEDLGYGKLNLLDVFTILGGRYRGEEEYIEYFVGRLFVRYPIN